MGFEHIESTAKCTVAGHSTGLHRSMDTALPFNPAKRLNNVQFIVAGHSNV